MERVWVSQMSEERGGVHKQILFGGNKGSFGWSRGRDQAGVPTTGQPSN